MERLIFLFALLAMVALQSEAQMSPVKLLKLPHDTISSYPVNKNASGKLWLEMDFGSPVIKNKEAVKALEGKLVYKIELIYTAYRLSETFAQPKLNKERLDELYKLYPAAFGRAFIIDWKFIAQTKGRDEYTAKKMYHGFVIHYTERPAVTTEAEVSFIDGVVTNDSLGEVKEVVRERKRVRRRKKVTDLYLPNFKSRREDGILYSKRGFFRKRYYETVIDTIYRYDTVTMFDPGPHSYTVTMRFGTDSTVLSVMNRNKDWKNMLVVCDVTGSMYPYSSQVLVWHKLNFNEKRTLGYTFFNDGDNKMDLFKTAGKVGGIYFADGTELRDVEAMAKKAMRNGGGGDAPENNVEALLAGLKKFPDCGDVVMIADNWANPRDMRLATKIGKPVHIILCGTFNGMINTEYLDLARRTGGSIHTIESDIATLAKLNEGESITIDGISYTIIKGKFVPVKKI